MSKVHADSRDGATINTVANYFHAQISTTDNSERQELLSTIQQQRSQAQESMTMLPSMFVKDDGAGVNFPAMKDNARVMNDDFGAPKGRRETEVKVAAGEEVGRVDEIAGGAPAKAAPEFELIRL